MLRRVQTAMLTACEPQSYERRARPLRSVLLSFSRRTRREPRECTAKRVEMGFFPQHNEMTSIEPQWGTLKQPRPCEVLVCMLFFFLKTALWIRTVKGVTPRFNIWSFYAIFIQHLALCVEKLYFFNLYFICVFRYDYYCKYFFF